MGKESGKTGRKPKARRGKYKHRSVAELVKEIAELPSEERAYMGPHAPRRYGMSDVLHSPKFRAGAQPVGESIGSGARRPGGVGIGNS